MALSIKELGFGSEDELLHGFFARTPKSVYAGYATDFVQDAAREVARAILGQPVPESQPLALGVGGRRLALIRVLGPLLIEVAAGRMRQKDEARARFLIIGMRIGLCRLLSAVAGGVARRALAPPVQTSGVRRRPKSDS